ncbi:MAG: FKBP-type peptidyl-prolyl cis-trans isomerase [Opitutaceae bacterium]|jgi:FKBP-type peptidyl-prolyl cis-trans isomerase
MSPPSQSAPPLRSFFYLLLLGVVLLTLALVVRSGIFEVKTHDEPINSAMRSAMSEVRPVLSTKDALEIDERYPTAQRTESGLRYLVRAPGTGTATPRPGDLVTVHYAGRLLDGTPIDSSYQGGVPFTFRIGEGHVIAGWEEAIRNMKKGEKRTLIIPYWLAYGAEGRPPTVPPASTLVFEVELLDFR